MQCWRHAHLKVNQSFGDREGMASKISILSTRAYPSRPSGLPSIMYHLLTVPPSFVSFIWKEPPSNTWASGGHCSLYSIYQPVHISTRESAGILLPQFWRTDTSWTGRMNENWNVQLALSGHIIIIWTPENRNFLLFTSSHTFLCCSRSV